MPARMKAFSLKHNSLQNITVMHKDTATL